jgi:putative PEP-CTERM system TPR-repeat lipoprotein
MSHCLTRGRVGASVVITTLMLTAGLSACSKPETSTTLMAEAQQYQQKGDLKAALIQLKNAATQSPSDAEVRFRLAELYVRIGDPVSAEKEIRKAIRLGLDNTRAMPVLARSLQAQGKPQMALDESAPLAAKAGPELLAARGDAYLALNDRVKAKEAYQQAAAAKSGYPEALIGLARVAGYENDVDAANRYTEQAIAANPDNAAVLFFKGVLLRSQNRTEEASATLSKAIALQPDFAAARLERAAIATGAKQFDAARADIDEAKKAAPNSVAPHYSQAVLDFARADYAAANDSLLMVLKVAPEHMPAILLAGAVDLNRGNLKQAEQHLKKYLEAFPDSEYARKLLAQVQITNSQPSAATATLAPIMKEGTKDSQVLAMAGQSAMLTQDFTKASQYFEQATVLAPTNVPLHTSLGVSRVQQGEHAKGISELERATALDPKSAAAGTALVKTALSLKQYDKALAAAKALVAAQPADAEVRTLEGHVYLAKGDLAGARASFEKAAALKPDLFDPVMNLATMDVAASKPEAAKQRLTAFLDKNNKSVGAMVALGALAETQKQTAEATAWYEKAAAENPEALAPSVKVVQHYLRNNQPAKALTLVRKMQTAHPLDPELLDLLGQVQLANNDQSGALNTYGQLVSVVPKSAVAQFRLATVHLRLNNVAAAAADLKKAVALDPNFVPAKMAQIDIAMARGNFDEGLLLARQIEKIDPGSAVGYLLEGNILAAQKKPEQAIKPLEQSLAISKAPQTLIQLLQAMKAAGRGKEADARLAQWQKDNPPNPMVSTYLGESLLSQKQYKAAIEHFESVAKVTPNNPQLLNNLAVAYHEQKDPRALSTAEQALKLAPANALMMDTVGWILVQQGDIARGLPLLRKAVALLPASTELRYHLAVALSKAGDKKNARLEVDKLLSDKKTFPELEEAKALQKIL